MTTDPTNGERKDMETNEKDIVKRLEAATAVLERRPSGSKSGGSPVWRGGEDLGEYEQSKREVELTEKLAALERQLAEVKAASAQNVLTPLRRTMAAATAEMLAKHGIGEGRWMCALSMQRCRG